MSANFIKLEQNRLLKASSVVAVITLLSRMSGLLRDIMIAHLFGSGAEIDAFFVAFRVPNFMRRLFADGAFSQALVPVLCETQQLKTQQQALTFISQMFGNVAMMWGLITVLGISSASLIIMLLAPGFAVTSSQFQLASHLLKVTFPYVFFISLTALCGAVLNTYQRVVVPAFTPILLNLVLVAIAYGCSTWFMQPVLALGWGVLIAGILQLLFQLPFLARAGLLMRPRTNWRQPELKRALLLMIPAIVGGSVPQINLLIDTAFASYLKVGSVTWLYYADRLTEFPLGMLGAAISTVMLPHLTRQYVNQSKAQYSESLDWGIRLVLLIGMPASLGMLILAGPMLATLLHSGKFTTVDVLQTSYSLMALSLGIPAFMLIKTLSSGFYAALNIKTPVKIAIAAILCNLLLCWILIKPMAHAGLTLASSVSGIMNALVLLLLLIKYKIYKPVAGWSGYVLQLAVANGCMVAWLMMRLHPVQQWLSWSLHHRVAELIFEIVVAIFIYGVSLRCCGFNFYKRN